MSSRDGTRSFRGASALILLLIILSPALARRGVEDGHRRPGRNGGVAVSMTVPQYARDVFTYVMKNGRAPVGYVGGRVWQNREHRLPAGGDYREYDVHAKVRGVNRGAERIIVDRPAGRGWYTGDHYRTFIPIGAQ
jgi:ribonuclease T1